MKIKSVYLCLLAALFTVNCSAINSVYVRDKYTDDSSAMIKKVIVVVKIPEKYPELAPLISNIAADIIKLKTNYLVYDYKTTTSENITQDCNKNTEGIFIFSIQHAEIKKNKIFLDLKSELYNCSTKELIWLVHAIKTTESDNTDLKELTIGYEKKYNNSAAIFAAPAFIVIQDIIESVPDPDLSDDEVDIKIKLDARK